jgi:pimeloyl-ACP methyl ester carboxylesterase
LGKNFPGIFLTGTIILLRHKNMKIKMLLLLFFYCFSGRAQEKYHTKYQAIFSQDQMLQMAYIYEKARNANGNTVLLLHGKNFSGAYFSGLIENLISKGYNVLAPDQVGFGSSSKPLRYQFSFQQLAVNTKLLLDTLGIKHPIILGHSMGGMIAVRLALLYPFDCKQLVLEDPLGLEDWKTVIPYTTIDAAFKTEKAKTTASIKKYMQENYFHGEWKPAYDELLKESSKNLNDTASAWCMALTSDMIYTQPVCYEFKNIKVPVALIVGELDRTAPGKENVNKKTADSLGNYPVLAKEAARQMKNCILVELKGLGHIPHIEDFGRFIASLDKLLYKN